MIWIDEQINKYSKLTLHMGHILANLMKFKQDTPVAAAPSEPEKEPKIIKELFSDKRYKCYRVPQISMGFCDLLQRVEHGTSITRGTETLSTQMSRCGTGQTHALYHLRKYNSFRQKRVPLKIMPDPLERIFPVTNPRKDFFPHSQGSQHFTTNIGKPLNMVVVVDLANRTPEDLIVIMGIIGCLNNKVRGDLQKLEALTLQNIIKLGEAFERKTFV